MSRLTPRLAVLGVCALLAACATPPVPTEQEQEGLELVRATTEITLRAPVDLLGGPNVVPAGTLMVRVEHSANAAEALVVPVRPGAVTVAWAPISDENGDTLLMGEAPTCPGGELTVPVLHELGSVAALCFGGEPFEFGALLPGFCGVGGGSTISGEPEWLNGLAPGVTLYGERVRPEDAGNPPASGSINARLAPGVSFTNCDQSIADQFHLVTAHFDDPASAECRTQYSDGAGVIDEESIVSVAMCRLTMVITATRPLPNR